MIDPLLPQVVADLAALPELPTHIVACTDDLFALTLLTEGGVDHLLRRLIGYGMPAVRALRLATYNAAYRLGRVDLGLVAAGRRADLIVLSDLEAVRVDEVYSSGVHVAHEGRMLVSCEEGPSVPPLHTVRVASLAPEDFVVRVAPDGSLPPVGTARMRVIDGVINTKWAEIEVEVTSARSSSHPVTSSRRSCTATANTGSPAARPGKRVGRRMVRCRRDHGLA